MRKHNQSGRLIKLLTALLIICFFAETGITSYVGVDIKTNQRNNAEIAARRRAYEEYQEQIKTNPPVIQYVGPEVHVIDGNLIRGEWVPVYTSENTVPASSYSSSTAQKVETQENIDEKASTSPSPSEPSSSGSSTSDEAPPEPSASSGSSSSSESNQLSGGNTATIQNSDGTYKHDFSGGRILGTKESNKYHNSDCIGARKIPPKNEVWYSSVAEAVADGRVPCGNCYR